MKFIKSVILSCALLSNAPLLLAADGAFQTGTVAQTIRAGSYIYIRLQEQDQWIATGNFPVAVGDSVQYSGGMEMQDFHSNILDRTFKSVYFIQHISLANKDSEATPITAAQAHASAGVKIPPTKVVQTPAAGEITAFAGGKTIADIFSAAEALAGQTINIHARVVKVNRNIMGKNWITLQDGTGSAPDNRLMATSKEAPSPGDTLLTKGVVRTNVDIGAGYKYKVLLENATFVRQAE